MSLNELKKRIPLTEPALPLLINPAFLRESLILKRSERFTREQLNEMKLRRLRNVCAYAYENTDYYREIFDAAGLNPYKIENPMQINVLPFLTKEMLVEDLPRFISKQIPKDRLVNVSTGGSTGIPLNFCIEKRVTYPLTLAHIWNHFHANGLKNSRERLFCEASSRTSRYTENRTPFIFRN